MIDAPIFNFSIFSDEEYRDELQSSEVEQVKASTESLLLPELVYKTHNIPHEDLSFLQMKMG